jgi:hypothetical protein
MSEHVPDRADLLTNAAATIDYLKAERVSIERQLDAMQMRLETVNDILARLTGTRRRRRTTWPVVSEAQSGEAESDLPPAA